jgi:hypothetical protein
MEMYQRILESINLLVENSKEMQDNEIVQKEMNCSPLSFAKEWATIKVCSARRSGHSTAIAHFVLNRKNEKWAIIAPSLSMVSRNHELINSKNTVLPFRNTLLFNNRQEIVFKEGGEVHFLSEGSFDRLRGQELDGIIVDCVSFMSQKKIEELYKVGMPSMQNKKYKFFIFIE